MTPLNFEEQQLIESVEKGEWKSIDNVADEIKKARQYAKNTFEQMATIYRQLTIEQTGQLLINQLPFRAGTAVEIIIRTRASNKKCYPLRGSNYQYNEPFEAAVSLEDWDSLQ